MPSVLFTLSNSPTVQVSANTLATGLCPVAKAGSSSDGTSPDISSEREGCQGGGQPQRKGREFERTREEMRLDDT